ncbi:MAG TPA: hypothetical protein VGL38_13890 [bacterium]
MKIVTKLAVFAVLLSACSIPALALPTEELPASLNSYLRAHYGSIERSPIPTGILYDLALPLSKIESLNGRSTSRAVTLEQWLQAAFELRHASLTESTLPEHTVFRDMGRQANRDHVYPLAILNFRYNRIKDGIPADSALHMDKQGVISIEEAAFTEQRAFAATALHTETYRGSAVRFRMDLNTLYFSNDPHPLKSVQIDFDDGAGFRAVPRSGDVLVHYSTTGAKTIRLRALQTDNLPLQAQFNFQVITLTAPSPSATWTLQAAIPYNSHYTTGEAYLYLAAGHDSLIRPVVVSEGFDLSNNMNWDELYALLNQQNLLETMRTMGYDAVVLNYTDATTYIEGNAYLLEALLEQVQQAIDPSRTYPLIGPSMGGLTTRFALDDMETNSRPHRVRTLINFDSPNRGANIPLGVQYWVDFFAGQSSSAAFLRDALNSPAAREMLIAHFTSPPSNVAGSDPLRATLLSDFASVGNYPTQPRKVAICNGSGNALGTDFSPGAQIIRYEYNSLFITLTGNVWALNNAASQQVFNGRIRVFPIMNTTESVTVQPTWPWDNAPGGQRNTMYQMDTTAAPYGDIVALHSSHCFIPTISALDVNVQDPFFNVSTAQDLYSLTPFDSLYFPTENQDHVTITPQNFWWLLNEIVDSLPAPVVVISTDSSSVRLNWTPAPGAQSYRIYSSTDFHMWPSQFASTADTLWVDPDTSAALKFYRVEATIAPAGLFSSAATVAKPVSIARR